MTRARGRMLRLHSRLHLGLLGRLIAILLIVLVVEFGTSTWLYERATSFSIRDDEARRLAEHLVIARRLIAERPVAQRSTMARELSTDRYIVEWVAVPPPPPATPELAGMRAQVLAWEPGLARSGLHVWLQPLRRGTGIAGDMRLADGSAVTFRMAHVDGSWSLMVGRLLRALAPTLALLLLGGLMIRATLRPLRALMEATARVGEGDLVPVRETGAGEVRALIHAFNAMQHRIHALITTRTQALAAVGHDLRTPLARLQLQLEDASDSADARDAMAGDLAEMEAMLESLLAFLGGDHDPEQPMRIDVAVLAATVVDRVADAGGAATYDGPDHLEATVQPSALRRALANLIGNAVHYGDGARVSVRADTDAIVLQVADDGPGIPDDKLAEVRAPFVRLDPARGRNTKGMGLGLAIVDDIAARMGGALTLENRAQGGLTATIRLPQS